MDSTSVCLLALGLIRAGAAQGPLHAFSLVYETLPDLAKEQRYVDAAVAGASAQLVHHRLPGDDLLDFDGFTDPPPHDEPTPWIESASGRAELSLAARLGVRSLLTGIGADDLLDIRPYHLSDLLRAGHGLTAWRDACGWAEAHRGNAFRVLRRYGFAGLPRNAWPGVGVWGRHRRTDTEEAAWRRVRPGSAQSSPVVTVWPNAWPARTGRLTGARRPLLSRSACTPSNAGWDATTGGGWQLPSASL